MAEESRERGGSWGIRMGRAIAWRAIFTILLGTAWLVGILLHWAFWSVRFDWFQNLIIVIASFIGLGGIIGILWVSTGLRSWRT